MHLTLGMSPGEGWRVGLMQSGERAHLTKVYEEEFRYLSLPTTKKGTAKVEPGRGVKIHYLYYFSKAFDARKVHGTQVPMCLSREKGTNLHPKRTPVDQLLKNVLAENGGHLTLEKGATFPISAPLSSSNEVPQPLPAS